MTEYSYVISVDQQQIDALDNKIKQLEELTGGGEGLPMEGLTSRISEILEFTQMRSQSEETETLEEIRNAVLSVKSIVSTILDEVRSIEIDEDMLSEIMTRLARDEFGGDLMGTRRVYEALERLEDLSKGETTVGVDYDRDQVMKDIDRALTLGGVDYDPLKMMGVDYRKHPVFTKEGDFQEALKSAKDFDIANRKVEEMAPILDTLYQALQSNTELLEELEARAGGAIDPTDVLAQFQSVVGGMVTYTYEPGDPTEPFTEGRGPIKVDVLDEAMSINDWMNSVELVMSTQKARIEQFNEEFEKSIKVMDRVGFGPTGGNRTFKTILDTIVDDALYGIEKEFEERGVDFFTDEKKTEYFTNLRKIAEQVLSLPENINYTRDDLKRLGTMGNIGNWDTTSDISNTLWMLLRDPKLLSDVMQTVMSGEAGSIVGGWLYDAQSEMRRVFNRDMTEDPMADLFPSLVSSADIDDVVQSPETPERRIEKLQGITSIDDIGRIVEERLEREQVGGAGPAVIREVYEQLKTILRHVEEYPEMREDVNKQFAKLREILIEHLGIDIGEKLPIHGGVGGNPE